MSSTRPATYPAPKIPMPPVKPPKQPCEHKYIYIETYRQRGERASFGISPAKEWKRIDRFYCEKCLDMKDIVKTAEGYEDEPEWF